MSRGSAALPPNYDDLLHGLGSLDVAIRQGAKGEMMRASEEQRAGMAEVVERLAAHGVGRLPSRMTRIPAYWYPKESARPRARLIALTPPDASAYGLECMVAGRSIFVITAVELCDADSNGARSTLDKAGKEAVQVSTWAAKQGGSDDVISKAG